jgi:cbb3-type cytochrome oxidase maturation protein
MTILYLVLPLALVFAAAAVAAFAWAVRSGQLDDVDTPPRRILFEDEHASPASTPQSVPTGAHAWRPRSGRSSARSSSARM